LRVLLAGFPYLDRRSQKLGEEVKPRSNFAAFHVQNSMMASPLPPSRRRASILAAAFLVAVPAYALATGGVPALAGLEPGRWVIRDLESNTERRSICIGDPMLLAQIEHDGPPCAAEVIETAPSGGTVRYTCPGRGFGHSRIRMETPRVASIVTQGINANRPFSFRAEARKMGDC
jgi:hypothetical protein